MAGVEELYREEFKRRVLAGRPRSVLEVGAGSGTFLHSVKPDINRLVGLDPDADAVQALQATGFEAVLGSAEHLPFQDREFDVVVFSYAPHHVNDWRAALKEAMRVARHSIEILDVWYDETVPDQRVARAFDRWLKSIDRLGGMVHNDTFSPGALIEPLLDVPSVTYDYVCRRVSAQVSVNDIEEMARSKIAGAATDAARTAGFEQIIADAKRFGMSEEGCIQMTIEVGS